MKLIKDLDWVYEKVSEYADIRIMCNTSIIYGGIIRDIIAKKEPLGDIDLAVSELNRDEQLIILDRDYKWKQIEKSFKAIKNETDKYKTNFFDVNSKQSVNSIIEFKSNGDKILQLITAPNIKKLIHNVDFICCGIGMDSKGNIIEFIDGAYDDCLNHKLRLNINHSVPSILVNKFKRRLTKLVKRGWEPRNISRDRKMLYKKVHIQKQKNKNKLQPTKLFIDREEFIEKNIYTSGIGISIHKNLIYYNPEIRKNLINALNLRFNMIKIRREFDNNGEINTLKIPFTSNRLSFIKSFFACNLPPTIEVSLDNNTPIHKKEEDRLRGKKPLYKVNKVRSRKQLKGILLESLNEVPKYGFKVPNTHKVHSEEIVKKFMDPYLPQQTPSYIKSRGLRKEFSMHEVRGTKDKKVSLSKTVEINYEKEMVLKKVLNAYGSSPIEDADKQSEIRREIKLHKLSEAYGGYSKGM